MRSIFQLAVAEWFASKVWIIFLVLFALGAALAPMAVASSLDPGLAAPAINQVLYGLAFLLCAFHGPIFAAEIGRAQSTRFLRTFWRTQGVGDLRYFTAMVGVAMVPVLFICVSAFALIRVTGSGELTTGSLAQAMTLTALAFMVPLPLCIGLSQRGGASFAFALTILASAFGFYAPTWLEFVQGSSDLGVGARLGVELGLTVIPQLRIGDQAERVSFAWEAIPAAAFLSGIGYLALCFVVVGVVGFILFRRKWA